MSEPQLPRDVRRRLAIIQHAEEVTGNVAMTCRYYGISRQVYYRWLRRYQEQGIDGLRDLSRRPHHSPNATHVDVVGKILYLRQDYHFGPAKIAMYLKRYHDVEVSQSGVWRILKRLDLNQLPVSQRYKRLDKRWKRYEKQLTFIRRLWCGPTCPSSGYRNLTTCPPPCPPPSATAVCTRPRAMYLSCVMLIREWPRWSAPILADR